jgi:hypothetical protein
VVFLLPTGSGIALEKKRRGVERGKTRRGESSRAERREKTSEEKHWLRTIGLQAPSS